jgi:alpha-1,2-mannosyltransferase
MVGSLADLTMVNSSWTKGHIQYLWRFARRTGGQGKGLGRGIHVVFPPVDTSSLESLPISKSKPREHLILSIGQFRPEKDHALQLKSFASLVNDKYDKKSNVKLILLGSCRNDDDRQRVDQLTNLANQLHILDQVEFVLNQPYGVLKDYLGRASIGLHTMWNEHFGIGVVEMMSAGLVTVAHDSGGPKADIIVRPWDFGKCLPILISPLLNYPYAVVLFLCSLGIPA